MDQDNPNNPGGGSGSYGSGSTNYGSAGTGSSAGSATGSGSTGGSTSASGSFGDLGSTGGGMASGGGSGATSGMSSGSSLGSMGDNFGSASGSTGNGGPDADDDTCPTCGQQKDRGGMGQFLGRLGITDEMVSNMKSSWDNVDIDEYLNTARDYLKDGSNKASRFAKENPGKVAAGVAVLALGAGLLYNATRDKSSVEVEFTPDYDRDRVVTTEQSGGGDRLRTDRAINNDRDNGPDRS
jgi:hypothetical protein